MQTSTDWLSYSPSRLISDDECEQYIEKVLGYYQSSLHRNSDAIKFLNNECGLSEARTLKKYKLGFADRTLARQLGAPNTFAGESVRGLLQRVGLMKPNGRETFLGMIIVPVMDSRGRLRGVYGHRSAKYVSRNVPYEAYHCSRSDLLFNEIVLDQFNAIVLCENPLDTLCLMEAGISDSVGLLTYEQFSDAHCERFKAKGIHTVILAFPRTAKGDRHATIVKKQLLQFDFCVDKLALKTGESTRSLWAKRQWFDCVLTDAALANVHRKSELCQKRHH